MFDCCSVCKVKNWNDLPLTLEMDHIDGDNTNDDLSNLRLLCPNCHSQTSTWRGRNIKKLAVSDELLLEALQTTSTIRAALIKVGMTPRGKNYIRASKLINMTHELKTVHTTNSQFGSMWVTKDQINKKIKPDAASEYIIQGWKLGRYIPLSKQPPRQNKGRFWITNGLDSRMTSPSVSIPDGWFKGRIHLTVY